MHGGAVAGEGTLQRDSEAVGEAGSGRVRKDTRGRGWPNRSWTLVKETGYSRHSQEGPGWGTHPPPPPENYTPLSGPREG